MKKSIIKVLSVVLVVVISLTSAPLSGIVGLELPEWLDFSIMSNAAETSGTCGENITWIFDETTGNLIISGTGEMKYYYKNTPWKEFEDEIKTVLVEDGITTIGNYAFEYCENLTSITIPDSVISIGFCSFQSCINLINIEIPTGVTRIDGSAFSCCENLETISIPNSVIQIGKDAFNKCYNLKHVYIADLSSWCNIIFNDYYSNPLYYGADLILNGERITELKIPEGVTIIRDYAFFSYRFLTSVIIPDSVSIIGTSAFTATSITDLKIGNGVKAIHNWAFSSCSDLTNVIISNSVSEIGEYAFSSCSSLTNITIPGNVITIGEGAFQQCLSLVDITICNGVKEIGYYAFMYCEKLTNVVIPDSVTIIGQSAFKYCYNLMSITIGDGVTTIHSWAFEDCINLANIKIGDNATKIGSSAFRNTAFWNNTDNWENDALYIGKYLISVNINKAGSYSIKYGTRVICDSAFSNCRNLTNIIIPDSVTIIGEAAFSCYNLENIIIPNSVTLISNRAFWGCTSLANITISDSVKSIGYEAFFNTAYWNNTDNWENGALYIGNHLIATNTELSGDYAIKDGTKSIADYALSGSNDIATVNIPSSVSSIGIQAFIDCASIRVSDDNQHYSNDEYGVLFNKEKTIIVQYPQGNTRTTYTIPDGVLSIGEHSFDDCLNLTSIKLANGVKEIHDYAFSQCSNLETITIPESVTTIDECAFNYCIGLGDVTIPGNTKTIGKYAFAYCKYLSSVTISDDIKLISDYAFSNCPLLKDVHYLGTEKQWNTITIGDYNDELLNATIHVTSSNNDATPLIRILCDENQLYGDVGDTIEIPIVYSSKDYSTSSLNIYSLYSDTVSIESVEHNVGDYLCKENEHKAVITVRLKSDGSSIIVIDSVDGASNFITVTSQLSLDENTITGPLRFATDTSWNQVKQYKYSYSDSLFLDDSTKYNHDLALMTMALEASACVPSGGWKVLENEKDGKWEYECKKNGNDYSAKKPANAYRLLHEVQFDTIQDYGYNSKPEFDSIACVVAAKNLKDSNTTVIAIAVRGSGYESEWGGNFRMGENSTNHEGFDIAKSKVLNYVEEFVAENGNSFNSNIKVWITGYSRGAAVANLVASEFNKGVGASYSNIRNLEITKKNVYAYCFETPKNTTDLLANSSEYNNIFSIVNPIDPVPYVAPSSDGFNFTRYGITYYTPATETVSGYNGQYGIKSQMGAMHEQIYGTKYTEDFKYYGFNIFKGFVENPNMGQTTFVYNLVFSLAKTGFKNRENYYENMQAAMMKILAMAMGGYGTLDKEGLMEQLALTVKSHVLMLSVGGVWTTASISTLKYDLASTIADNTELSFEEAYNIVGELDSILLAAVSNPNLTYTAVMNYQTLFIPHYFDVLVGWMAYLDSVPESQRVKLMSTKLNLRYFKTNCPVDVNVYDEEGNLVASIVNDEVVPLENSLSTYIDENGQKCVVLPYDEEYSVKIIAREDCKVTCSVLETDGETGGNERAINYYDMEVNCDETISCIAEEKIGDDDCNYTMSDEDGDMIFPDETLEGDKIVSYVVTTETNVKDVSIFGSGEHIKGEFAQVIVSDIEGYNFIGWFIDDELITTDYQYRFCVLEDVTLTAVYERLQEPEYNYTFSIQKSSRTEIRNKDGIILHANLEGNAPNGSYVRWESSNGNFDKSADGSSLKIIAKNKGYTTFTAILCDADGKELARDSVEMYSKSGFFDKIGGFFRGLFGLTKIYEN